MRLQYGVDRGGLELDRLVALKLLQISRRRFAANFPVRFVGDRCLVHNGVEYSRKVSPCRRNSLESRWRNSRHSDSLESSLGPIAGNRIARLSLRRVSFDKVNLT